MNVTCTAETCPIVLNSKCVFYEGAALADIGVNTNDSIQTALQKINDAFSSGGAGGGGTWGSITGTIIDQVDLITYLQENYVQSTSDVFAEDVTISLSGGKTFGKYSNGETAPWTGLTAIEAILDAAIEYIDPAFSAFSISGQSTTVEVGTTLSGSKTFIWTLAANSGTVNTIDIYDNTAGATLLAGTPNDGSEAQVITTIQLNSNGATQSWKGIANNTNPVGTINSSNFVVTSRYYRFFGPVAASPADSAAVRALGSSSFHTGATTFTMETGATQTKFVVALPPGVTITSVIDIDALNANITSEYILTGTVNVTDAGGTARAYNIYEMNVGSPYSSSHTHSITTAN